MTPPRFAGSGNLVAGNIRNGVNIFGVVGNFVGWVDSTYVLSGYPVNHYSADSLYLPNNNDISWTQRIANICKSGSFTMLHARVTSDSWASGSSSYWTLNIYFYADGVNVYSTYSIPQDEGQTHGYNTIGSCGVSKLSNASNVYIYYYASPKRNARWHSVTGYQLWFTR